MTKLTFTRYLYALDECLLTLQEAILKRESFDECILQAGKHKSDDTTKTRVNVKII